LGRQWTARRGAPFGALLEKRGRDTFLRPNPLLALLVEAAGGAVALSRGGRGTGCAPAGRNFKGINPAARYFV